MTRSLVYPACLVLALCVAACRADPPAEEPASTPEQETIDRGASIWEQAKLRGVDYRAVGNEPGWVLEIGPERIELRYDYDESRVVLPQLVPLSDVEARRTTYRGEAGSHTIEIVIEGVECSDTMSGEKFDSRVTVSLDQRVFHGCGRALH
ncbi:MAG: hypothetical protein GY716_20975 [bacterium]|nr:hypothetical protein [bacterium]